MSKTKISLILMLAGTVTFFGGLVLYSTMDTLSMFEIGTAIFVTLITIGGVVIARSKLRDEKKGLPADDELSTVIKEKAASRAFVGSFYIWIFILLFFTSTNLDVEVIIGGGVMAMGVLFMAIWFYYTKAGVNHENQN